MRGKPCIVQAGWLRAWITDVHCDCSPGRFFAANELKSMMAHLVMTYDVKMAKLPAPMRYASMVSPDRTAKIFFRKRQGGPTADLLKLDQELRR
jgi:hypothetical protein